MTAAEPSCPYKGLMVAPSMARELSKLCRHGDECKCKAWRSYEPPPSDTTREKLYGELYGEKVYLSEPPPKAGR